MVTHDAVFGPAIVKGQCICRVCGELIFGADAALAKWDEPIDLWVHYLEPDDGHVVVFGGWQLKE